MEKSFMVHRGGTKIVYQETEDIKQELFDAFIKWCEKYGAYSGEQLSQNDDCQIYAPEFMADTVDDIMQFKIIDMDPASDDGLF
jgi:hypothetical protein